MSIEAWSGIIVLLLSLFIGLQIWIVNTISAMKVQLGKQEVQLLPLSALIQAQLLNLLHHDEGKYKEPDALIDKLSQRPEKFTGEEFDRLKQLMNQRIVADDIPEIERKRAAALVAYMDIVVIERMTTSKKMVEAATSLVFGAALASFRYWHH